MRQPVAAVVTSLLTILPSALAADSNAAWEKLPGTAQGISVGADGSVWAVGSKPAGEGYAALRWNGKDWDEVGGVAATRIAVDPKGVPWVINVKHEIVRREKEAWEKLPGKAQDIGIGADGSVWAAGTKKAVGG